MTVCILNIKQKGLEYEIDFPFFDAKVQLFWETSKGFSIKIQNLLVVRGVKEVRGVREVRGVKKLSL